MKRNKSVICLFVAIITCSWPVIALAQQPKVIELVMNDGGAKTATITMDDENLLFEVVTVKEVLLLTAKAAFSIDHADKTYREI